MSFTRLVPWVVIALAATFGMPGMAQSYSFQEFSIPHPPNSSTLALGINNLGGVAGELRAGPVTYGFKRFSGGALKYPILDPNDPRYDTYIMGINDAGTMVGAYTGTDGNLHGFVDQGGAFTTVDVGSGNQTAIWGINYKGDFVGVLNYGQSSFFSVNGVVTQFTVPGSTETSAYGIAADGTIVGCTTKNGQNISFIRSSDGAFRLFAVQGAAAGTCAHGINNGAGTIVGLYEMAQGASVHGFLYNYRANPMIDGSEKVQTPPVTTLDYLNAQNTQIMGINDHGAVVGFAYLNSPPFFGFIATPQQ